MPRENLYISNVIIFKHAMSQGVIDSLTCRVGESTFECLKKIGESDSRQLIDSPSWGVAMVSRGVTIKI
jgi:hypothetical protein